MDTNLITYMRNQLAGVPVDFQRYMYERINWNDRLFGLVGPRGVGKTILFLQYIKQNFDRERILYISADNTYFAAHSLVDTADEFSREGGQHLFIDEIHKYPNWSRELKQIYDTHPDLKIAFTGSSILDINKGEADLSRRAPMYYMQGLSFREYLVMFHKITVPKYELKDILANRAEIAAERHPLPLFRDYLQRGYYPFATDSRFDVELNQVINFTMEVDIPQFAKMNVATGQKLKKLLAIVAESSPFKPVMDKISKMINVSRNDVGDYFYYMERAGMIGQLRDATGGIIGLGKVEKIYLDNTNLAYVLGGNATNIGNVRETFFFNQMRVNHKVMASEVADFKIDKITFEVGGKSKRLRQIANVNDGFVVKDDIEYGSGNIVPLWAFGLNY
ncbi:MAG: ATP-binding protein [Salinivirgaceae bacterium]|nr:ATP-binding protein [Salinivirgaceae bacterium]